MINRKPSGRDKKRGVVAELKVNLSDKEAREAFIKSRLDMLFSEITDAYGQTLAAELRRRLEYTIKVFHEDTIALLNEMAEHSRVKMAMNDEIRQGKSLDDLLPDEANVSDEPLVDAEDAPTEKEPDDTMLFDDKEPAEEQDLPSIPSKKELFRPRSESKPTIEGDL